MEQSQLRFPLSAVALTALACCLPGVSAELERLPLQRETRLCRNGVAEAVILAPEAPEYQALAQQLSRAVGQRTGVVLPVANPADLVMDRPRAVKPETLDRHFILIGQFWNNAVLERLYAGMFDPTDAGFPGPGGYELRTVCSPFAGGHNCLVVTGSDLDGCRRAVAEFASTIETVDARSFVPFVHRVVLGGPAAAAEASYRQHMSGPLANIDRYATFGHPQPLTWTGENPDDFLVWKDRNLAMAAYLGLRFWATGDTRDGEVFKRLVLGCREQLERLEQCYREGRSDLVEYSLDGLTIAWDLVEETDLCSDREREQITDYLYRLAWLNRDAYFVYKCAGLPPRDVLFHNRHQHAGTLWMGLQAEYMQRNCRLSPEQAQLSQRWLADAAAYHKRLSQSYFYSDGVALVHDEGGLVLRYALKLGDWDFIDNGCLRLLADYWVANHGNTGYLSSSGHCGSTRHPPRAGEVLNIADWLYPKEGYRWFRTRLGPSPYQPFLFYGAAYGDGSFPFYNWETPPSGGEAKLTERLSGVTVLPVGPAFDEYLRRHPDMFQGGYQRVAGRYRYAPAPYDQTYKRISLRSGFGASDQYVVIDGLQGLEWSYDDINSLVAYDDLGRRLLKSQWDARNVESRLELNSLFVSDGHPGARQSVAARLVTACDLGPQALLASLAADHDGVQWTRRLYWQKKGWLLVADDVLPQNGGDHFLAQTWLSWHPFQIERPQATAQAGEVTLHLVGTPERHIEAAGGQEGVRQVAWAHLEGGKPTTLWTLLYAGGPTRTTQWALRQIGPQAALLTPAPSADASAVVAFRGELQLNTLRLRADMGLVSPERLTLAGCREVAVAGRTLYASDTGGILGWDLSGNVLQSGKEGFALRAGDSPPELLEHRDAMQRAVAAALACAAGQRAYVPPEFGVTRPVGIAPLRLLQRLQLRTPVSLAVRQTDAAADGELLLYDDAGAPRFAYPAFDREPAAVDFDGTGRPDIAFALGKSVEVYRPDGSLRWRHEVSSPVGALSAGSLSDPGREDLGLAQHNWATVLDGSGQRVIDEEAFRYSGLGGAFGDVDGDGRSEFVAVTTSGLNVHSKKETRRSVSFASYFGTTPCRVWLLDLDGDEVTECYVGGAGTDPACYDLKALRCRWSFAGAPIHPRDVALCDINGDGRPEIVSGGADGFLYVVDSNGGFLGSRSLGAPITRLATLPADAGVAVLLVGLQSGEVLTVGRDLAPVARGCLQQAQPVDHLAVLRRTAWEGRPTGGAVVVAAGASGDGAWFAVGE